MGYRRILMVVCGMVIGAAPIVSGAPAASAAGAVVTNYTGTGIDDPYWITTGPDGALWFTNHFGNSIGRITPAGTVSNYYDSCCVDLPQGITSGPDGALWFTNPDGRSLGQLTTDGSFSAFGLGTKPTFITTGSDGALWFVFSSSTSAIGRLTTSGTVNYFTSKKIIYPNSITVGPDGAMWFTNQIGGSGCATGKPPCGSIGRIDATGTVIRYTGPGIDVPNTITTGPDGALWFTSSYNSIGRITTAGVLTNYTGKGINNPIGIIPGPDGNLWFTNGRGNSIGRITTSGLVTNYTDPSISEPTSITAGPDGALWFTNSGNNTIGRITVAATVNPSPHSGGPGTAITASGSGYSPGETVTVAYMTGLTAPEPKSVIICTATADTNGTFTCNGTVPSAASAGATGPHKINAKGETSLTKGANIFLLA